MKKTLQELELNRFLLCFIIVGGFGMIIHGLQILFANEFSYGGYAYKGLEAFVFGAFYLISGIVISFEAFKAIINKPKKKNDKVRIIQNNKKIQRKLESKKCNLCGEIIDKRATSCLHCGEPTQTILAKKQAQDLIPSDKLKIISWVLIGSLPVFIFISYFQFVGVMSCSIPIGICGFLIVAGIMFLMFFICGLANGYIPVKTIKVYENESPLSFYLLMILNFSLSMLFITQFVLLL